MASFNMKNMRIIHMERIVPEEKAEFGLKKSGNYQELSYMGIGYYDKMTYVRPKEKLFDYNHCFLIKYPYQKTGYKMMADQMFVLLDDQNDILVSNKDPFEYMDDGNIKPFLGMILVTVYKKEPCDVLFQQILEGCRDKIHSILGNENYSDDITRIFWTPNCADLCVVIRTDVLNHLYEVKSNISILDECNTSDEKKAGIGIHTIEYSFLTVEKKFFSSQLIKKNNKNSMELRMSGTESALDEIKNKVGKQNVYGTNGVGDWAVTISFSEFAEIYQALISLKFRDFIECEKQLVPEITEDDSLYSVFKRNEQNLRCLYIRPRFELTGENSGVFVLDEASEWTEGIMKRYRSRLDSLNSESIPLNRHLYDLQLREQLTLIKELLYTYSDFLYQKSSEWKGVMFYSQIECLLNGLQDGIAFIDSLKDVELKDKYGIKLVEDTNKAVSCINGFNKLLQSINQYVTNVPNYEVQTKVNVEKYLMAYTMYLLEISKLYYNSNKKQLKLCERIFPIFTMDLTILKIKADTLFGQASVVIPPGENEIKKRDVFFAVSCPNYQWFANIYHVLPMITHEISHNYRYMESRAERNEFVLQQITGYVSTYLVDQMIAFKLKRNLGGYTSGRQMFLIHTLKEKLYEFVHKSMKEELPFIRLQDMADRIAYALKEILGLHTAEEYSGIKLWDSSCEILIEMAEISGIEFITSEDLTYRCEKQIIGDECNLILVNLVIDLLIQGEIACEGWSEALSMCKGEEETIDVYLQFLKDILRIYKKKHAVGTDVLKKVIAVLSVQLYLKVKSIWRNKSPELAAFVEKMDEDLFMESSEGEKLLDKFRVNTAAKYAAGKDEKLWEAIEEVCHFYELAIDLRAGIQWNSTKWIKKEDDSASNFARALHDLYYKEYMQLCMNPSLYNNWILSDENQRMFLSMGVASADAGQFIEYFRDFIGRVAVHSVIEMIKENIQLYQEVFADISMCSAFQFTAYGYFMYSIHIFMKERELCTIPSKEFTVNRFNIIILSLMNYNTTQEKIKSEKEFNEYLFTYFCKLVKYITDGSEYGESFSMIKKFAEVKEEHIDLLEEKVNLKTDREKRHTLERQIKMLRWMQGLYSIMSFEDDTSSGIKKDLILHAKQIKSKIDCQDWIRNCRENMVIRDIGEYYNNYTIESVIMNRETGHCLEMQHEFVKQYYEKMQDCINKVRMEIVNQENYDNQILSNWFKVGVKEDI